MQIIEQRADNSISNAYHGNTATKNNELFSTMKLTTLTCGAVVYQELSSPY